jgi:hypothetical protein
VTGRINAYNPIGICYNAPQDGHYRKPRGYRYTPFYHKRVAASLDDEPDCNTDDHGLIAFFNSATVQKQLNVGPMEWQPCSDDIWQKYTWGTTTIPLFPLFKQAGLQILIFSGNVDAVVPTLETEEYLRKIGWKVT